MMKQTMTVASKDEQNKGSTARNNEDFDQV